MLSIHICDGASREFLMRVVKDLTTVRYKNVYDCAEKNEIVKQD